MRKTLDCIKDGEFEKPDIIQKVKEKSTNFHFKKKGYDQELPDKNNLEILC